MVFMVIFMTVNMIACENDERTPPDYSDSVKALNMYAHVVPTDGQYNDLGSPLVKFSQDHRTLERFTEYKECGFDTLLLLGNDPFNRTMGAYQGGPLAEDEWRSTFNNKYYKLYRFEGSQLKRNMDTALQADLKVIVFDVILHDLSEVEGGLIGEGKAFANEDELDEFVAERIAPYKDHPAFYGVTLRDEPHYVNLESFGQTYRSLKRVCPDIYIPLPLLGMNTQPQNAQLYIKVFSGPHYNEFTNVRDAFNFYIDTVLESIPDLGITYYPSRINTETGKRELDSIGLYQLQLLAKKLYASGGKNLVTIVQSAANNYMGTVNEDMIRYNTNAALAFGSTNLVYFTYWMFPWKTQELFTQGIMDDFGNKILYDEVKKINGELKKLAKVVLNYKYEKSHTAWVGNFGPVLAGRLEESEISEFADVTAFEVSSAALINQMYDAGKDIHGYYIINLNDPGQKNRELVTVTFKPEFKYAAVYNKGERTLVKLEKNKLNITLEEGDSAFVIPY